MIDVPVGCAAGALIGLSCHFPRLTTELFVIQTGAGSPQRRHSSLFRNRTRTGPNPVFGCASIPINTTRPVTMTLACDFFLRFDADRRREHSRSFEPRERAAGFAQRLPDDRKINNIKTKSK